VVNYEDPNYNIGLPVFMIHGTLARSVPVHDATRVPPDPRQT
jgi:hypothetical protein